LASESISERLSALNDAVQYGEHAIDLVLQALRDDAEEVRRLARKLLRDRLGEDGKEALLDWNLMRYFITINNWQQEIYDICYIDPEYTSDPDNIAYVIDMDIPRLLNQEKNRYFEYLINTQESGETGKIQALIININDRYYDFFNDKRKYESFRIVFDMLNSAKETLKDLRLLQIGDKKKDFERDDDNYEGYSPKYIPKHKNTHMYAVDIRPLLQIFPNLEYLNINGNFHDFFSFSNPDIKNFRSYVMPGNKLKTLIIDNKNVNRTISKLYPVELPELEYFEIWFNNDENIFSTVQAISQVLAGKTAPKLKYLALRNCLMADDLVKALLQTPIVEKLAGLDFHEGGMTEYGIQYILDCPKLSNLKLLNVSSNCISNQAIEQLKKLPFKIEYTHQYSSKEHRDININRYWRSNEY
jgi:hypothetical protein